jgi:hypothetical protein
VNIALEIHNKPKEKRRNFSKELTTLETYLIKNSILIVQKFF